MEYAKNVLKVGYKMQTTNNSQQPEMKFSDRARSRFIELRAESGLNLEEFGARLKVGKTTIHAIESGQNKPSLNLIDRAEIEFGVKF